jgi:hypothetical protein
MVIELLKIAGVIVVMSLLTQWHRQAYAAGRTWLASGILVASWNVLGFLTKIGWWMP